MMPGTGAVSFVAPEPSDVASPCTNLCSIDPATGWCIGCARAIDEIMDWGTKPHAVRRAILATLPARHALIGG